MLIDWGAEWCINCKVVEARVLFSDEGRQAFRAHNAVLLRADVTTTNEPAQRLNERLKGQSIPVLAIFSPRHPLRPVVLRDLYTRDRVITELKNAR